MSRKYNLVKEHVEVKLKDKELIKPGITTSYKDDHFPVVIRQFDNKHDALEALKAYAANVHTTHLQSVTTW